MIKNKKLLYPSILLVASMIATFFMNKGMFSAFIFLFLSLFLTFFFLKKYNKLTKTLAVLLCISFLLHFALVMFIYVTDFRPFGGGADYEGYQLIAQKTAVKFWQGNFSLDEAHYGHDFPVVIAVLYAIFGSDPLVGRFFVVWLFLVSVLFVYFITTGLGGTEKNAFWVGFFMNFYPSYAYFGSLLLKDVLIIPLIFLGILLIIEMIKNFSWKDFIVFFLITVVVSYLRFYVGYALILAFVISWFLSLKKPMHEKFWLGVTLSLLLTAFSPFLSAQGYFGWKVFDEFLNPDKITQYREISYNPDATEKLPNSNDAGIIGNNNPNAAHDKDSGKGSSFLVETGFKDGPITFIKNSSISFVYTLFGPFVWQLRSKHQYVSLIEVVPWYAYIVVVLYFMVGFVKKDKLLGLIEFIRKTAPLWSFAILALGALSLFINNYGIIARIRIPMFISLIIVMSLLLNKKYIWRNT